jgi:hypothetical protein
VGELARRIVAAPGPVDPVIARRVVACVLDWQGRLGEVLAADQLFDAPTRRVASQSLAQAAFLVVDLETTGERDRPRPSGTTRSRDPSRRSR